MKYQNIIVEKEDTIGVLTLNRPEVLNALDARTWSEVPHAMDDFRRDDKIRVVIITGAGGKAFAAGSDIRSLKERNPLDNLKSDIQQTLIQIENLEKPVIAAIDGFALGGGCELALACDIRIATKKSKIGSPEVALGLIPGAGATQRLQRLVGIGKAKELIFTGDIIPAQEAKAIGLLNKVVEKPEDLLPAAKEMAEKIIRNAPMAVTLSKMAINTGANIDINSGLFLEKLAQTVAFYTDDRMEGIDAFLEKRKPTFKNK